MKGVVVIDYGASNLRSVVNALRRLGCEHVVSAEASAIRDADRVIFPGVGGAPAAMAAVRRAGIDVALKSYLASGRPLLGICLGSQIVFESSEEGDTECIGLLRGRVRLIPRMSPSGERLKIPHMGWNAVRRTAAHPVLDGVADGTPFYFVHSYYVEPASPRDVLATVEYGAVLPAVIGSGSFVATQFHLEKSGAAGLAMLASFIAWDGKGGGGEG